MLSWPALASYLALAFGLSSCGQGASKGTSNKLTTSTDAGAASVLPTATPTGGDSTKTPGLGLSPTPTAASTAVPTPRPFALLDAQRQGTAADPHAPVTLTFTAPIDA